MRRRHQRKRNQNNKGSKPIILKRVGGIILIDIIMWVISRGHQHPEAIKATDANVRDILKEEIGRLGENADLNHIDVSNVTNMSYLFLNSHFNGDIGNWDVSNVTDMTGMFINSKFDGNISKWRVGKVKKNECCFDGSPLEKQPNKQPKFNP